MKLRAYFFVAGFLLFFASRAKSIGLQEFLQNALKKHSQYQALELSKEASTQKKISGDLANGLMFQAKASLLDDKKPQYLGVYTLDQMQSKEVSLGIMQKTLSSTQWALTLTGSEATQQARISAPPASVNTTSGIGSLSLSLSQSLWKDAFGRSNELRHTRESWVERLELQSLELQAKQITIDAENAFWEHLYLKQELQQKKESLERAKRIESWIQKRLVNGINDRADLLNAQGLVAMRELSLLNTEDDLKVSRQRVKDLLELKEKEELPPLEDSLDRVRNPQTYVQSIAGQEPSMKSADSSNSVNSSSSANSANSANSADSSVSTGTRVVRSDAYLQYLEAKVKSSVAMEAQESVKADLTLEGQYKTNGYDQNLSSSYSKVTNTDHPTTAVSLKWTWMMDSDVKKAAVASAKKEALSSEQKWARKLLESETSWKEILRRHQELSLKIEAAKKMSQIQTQKAAAEQDKLTKGRTITSQVITAEQDASDSQLTLMKMKAEQRKLEAQSKNFLRVDNF